MPSQLLRVCSPGRTKLVRFCQAVRAVDIHHGWPDGHLLRLDVLAGQVIQVGHHATHQLAWVHLVITFHQEPESHQDTCFQQLCFSWNRNKMNSWNDFKLCDSCFILAWPQEKTVGQDGRQKWHLSGTNIMRRENMGIRTNRKDLNILENTYEKSWIRFSPGRL